MNTSDVAAMIDYLVNRYGLDAATPGTGARLLCLGWLQEAEQEAWGKGSWWFKEARVDLALVGGTSEYSLSVRFNRIHAVEAGDGGVLTRLSPRDFRELAGSDASGGYPRLWCPLEPLSTGYSRIKVWPVPVAAGTLKVLYDKNVTELADSGSSKSGFPEDWRHVVLLRAEVHASLHQGQQGQAEGFMGTYQEQVGALLELNGRMARSEG